MLKQKILRQTCTCASAGFKVRRVFTGFAHLSCSSMSSLLINSELLHLNLHLLSCCALSNVADIIISITTETRSVTSTRRVAAGGVIVRAESAAQAFGNKAAGTSIL